MRATRTPTETKYTPEVDCSPAIVPTPVSGLPSVVEMDAAISTCEDCDVVLTEDNTRVTYEEAFWLGVDWTSERYCETCKDRREADGSPDSAINYDPPDTSCYREQLRMAGRGHLLG